MDSGVIHVAGADLNFNGHLRQRCVWCGTTLIDQNLNEIQAEVNSAPMVPHPWPVGTWVLEKDGTMTISTQPIGQCPQNSCLMFDPMVTR